MRWPLIQRALRVFSSPALAPDSIPGSTWRNPRFTFLIATSERHGLGPQKYLRSVLAKIGQTNLSELKQFMPDVWKKEDEQSPSTNVMALPNQPARS